MSILDEPSRQPLPKSSPVEDFQSGLVKGGLGALPFVGSLLAEQFGNILALPLAQRKDDWLESIARRVLALEENGLKTEDLGKNPEFVSTIFQATQIAISTHQSDKLEALRNAVLNTALDSTAHDDNHRAAFLGIVDRLTPAHLQILRKLAIPANYSAWTQPKPFGKLNDRHGPIEWVRDHIPTLTKEDDSFIRLLIDDLRRSGLILLKADDPYIPRELDWKTPLGREFLKFISKPARDRFVEP